MSEYQYYEFQAIDRPLTDREMSTLRDYLLVARHDHLDTVREPLFLLRKLQGEREWMDKYFDAFLYLANWGTHELISGCRAVLLTLETAQRYLIGDAGSARAKGGAAILYFLSEDEFGVRVKTGLSDGDRSIYLVTRFY